MAGFTDHDAVAQAIRPAIARMRNAAAIDRELRVDQAIDESGGLKPAAILSLPFFIVRGDKNDVAQSTTSTVNWVEMIDYTLSLPDITSRWGVLIEAEFRGGVADGTSIDAQLLLNGQILDSITRTGPTASAAPFFLQGERFGELALVGGEYHIIGVRFKSDTGGNATVNNVRMKAFCTREA